MGYHNLHFRDEKTEAQKSKVTFLKVLPLLRCSEGPFRQPSNQYEDGKDGILGINSSQWFLQSRLAIGSCGLSLYLHPDL